MTPRVTRVLAALVGVVLLSTIYVLRIRTGMADFAVNYRAGQRLAAGETLYQTTDGHYMFKYFPSSALLYLPLTPLPLEAAKAVWFGLSLVALWGAFRIADRLVPHKGRRYVALLSGLVLAKYVLHELRLGQINILVTLVLLASLQALSGRRRPSANVRAGTLAGLAVALKPHAILFVAYLMVKRSWGSVATALGTLGVLLAVPAIFYGIDGNMSMLRQWATTLSESTPGLLTTSDNVSVWAFFTKWLGDPGRALAPAAATLGVLAILTLAVILRGRSLQEPEVLEVALVLTLVPLVSPLGWDYVFLMSLLAVMLVMNYMRDFPTPARVLLAANFAIIALALYDVMGREAYATFMQLSVTTANFVLIVLALAYLRFRQVC
jgi:alpha-1,2-mannosyltransferase